MTKISKRSLFKIGAAITGAMTLDGVVPQQAAAQTAPPKCATDYKGNQPRSTNELKEWHAKAEVPVAVEPDLPIVDPHHHLFGSSSDRLYYELDDLKTDLDSGHRVIGTVYVEAYDSGWRTTGPVEMRPVGETEKIAKLTERPIKTVKGECHVAAGIVCFVDLTLGDGVPDVLDAHLEVSDGRLRGLRHRTQRVEGDIACVISNMPPAQMTANPAFRRGLAQLSRYDLPFDVSLYHPQIAEVIDLVDAFPNTVFVLNHVAVPIGVAEFSHRRTETVKVWEEGIRRLAERPNTRMKVGGMGQPIFGYGFERREAPASAQELAQAWKPRFSTCIEAFGSDRCMFESNFPVDKQSASYCDTWSAFKLLTADASAQDRANLFYRSACKTYRLDALEKQADQEFLP